MNREVVGEGAYGCVHSPSIPCKYPPYKNFNYNNYVSKLMKTDNALIEMSEFDIIENIDKERKYHLGKPILCEPDLNDKTVKNDINKCKYIKFQKNKDYKLLIQNNGGINLHTLCIDFKKYFNVNINEKIDMFLLEIHNLINGLKLFKDNNLVHNDIKPQNILFNTETGELKYIDFGLMREKSDIILSCFKNENYLGLFHWSFPFDCGFMNIGEYNKYELSSNSVRNSIKQSLINLITGDSTNNHFKLNIKNANAFDTLFSYLDPNSYYATKNVKKKYVESFFEGFDDLIYYLRYIDVLNMIIDSIDIFCLGFSMQFVINNFKKNNALSSEDYIKLTNFFSKMHDFNPSNRIININILLNEYEKILFEMGVLTRLNKDFIDNVIINTDSIPKNKDSIPKQINTELIKSPTVLNNKTESNKQVEESIFKNKKTIKTCPSEKELNPITNRCVKKCKEGYERDHTFKCKKIDRFRISSSIKNKKTKKIIKICPSEKELNPITNRCVKKCKEGYERDDTFKCKKIDKFRISSSIKNKKTKKIIKTCPSEKELNPITNRCVKKCKEGYERDNNFKCYKNINV